MRYVSESQELEQGDSQTPTVVRHGIESRSIWQVIGAVLLTLLALAILYRAKDQGQQLALAQNL
jgi:hypothetical protein